MSSAAAVEEKRERYKMQLRRPLAWAKACQALALFQILEVCEIKGEDADPTCA